MDIRNFRISLIIYKVIRFILVTPPIGFPRMAMIGKRSTMLHYIKQDGDDKGCTYIMQFANLDSLPMAIEDYCKTHNLDCEDPFPKFIATSRDLRKILVVVTKIKDWKIAILTSSAIGLVISITALILELYCIINPLFDLTPVDVIGYALVFIIMANELLYAYYVIKGKTNFTSDVCDVENVGVFDYGNLADKTIDLKLRLSTGQIITITSSYVPMPYKRTVSLLKKMSQSSKIRPC